MDVRMRYCTTPELLAMMDEAKERDFGQQLPPEVMKDLDGAGKHMFLPARETCEGVRARAMIKVLNSIQPKVLVLDVDRRSWEHGFTVYDAAEHEGV